jgi:hypothetical protein
VVDEHEYYRTVAARVPQCKSLLAAEFNYDWELDWPDVESVLVNDFDEASRAENMRYREELGYLLGELPTDRDVDGFFRFVGSGLSPRVDLGQSARSWLAELRDRAARNVETEDRQGW